ncbi:class B sortase [Butyrivibrio sp. MC2013]|uniref:class B sortase n=1 Tax=Butyrivibrio sp. MC2013 TaxID=1280686 RepID=UPI000411B016|nr:class B sortase [Butyrivibrio sp. MC2013]
MKTLGIVARIGNFILSIVAGVLILSMSSYAAFSLWSNYITDHRAFGTGMLEFKPDGKDSLSFKELQAINPDCKAWITIDDTNIDYPVMQGEFDYEYLNKDAFGEYVLSGSIFMSTTNDEYFTDPYTLIYGHHMDNGAMFGDIDKFLVKSFFDSHKTGTLYLADESYELEVFASVSTDAYDPLFYSQASQHTRDLPALAGKMLDAAVCSENVDIAPDDRIIALSTCADAVTNGRYILLCKIKP